MTKGILGRKLGMTQVFAENGIVVPVTVIQTGAVVLQKKDEKSDGYNAIQIGFGEIKENRAIQPVKGHAKKAGTTPKRFVRELRNVDVASYEVGQELNADVFTEGEFVDVTGVSKGKGFAGVIKRHGQASGPMAHGSRYHRRPGSMGAVAPNRVFKGKALPGRMGGERVTIQNLEIVKVDTELNVILVKGSIPGPKKAYLTIKSSVKAGK